eukprot:CAMPEP_0202087658 /NCGR_PEP_ID=MMETSP0964-20121228/36695_1 /ASSEMBLY_ACC=CAM_ASM_000500 /TAXON_ID=4773 /ORGANISM="Schizochytrium aggregatum, Strain ATCC28209" /LENGTH=140 /DNA_ID=CAMNT_0048655629 /DNA_START=37 /DNA_END=455 /DNA_ORIENTATION=+
MTARSSGLGRDSGLQPAQSIVQARLPSEPHARRAERASGRPVLLAASSHMIQSPRCSAAHLLVPRGVVACVFAHGRLEHCACTSRQILSLCQRQSPRRACSPRVRTCPRSLLQWPSGPPVLPGDTLPEIGQFGIQHRGEG